MNVVDFVIVISALIFLAAHVRVSFVFYAFSVFGLLLGYTSGLFIATLIAPNLSSDLQKAVASLVLMIGLAIAGCFVGIMFGSRTRTKLMLTKFYKPDKYLTLPFKLFSLVLIVFFLAETLVFVPILGLQYVAQGSTFLYAFNKKLPNSGLSTVATKISPDQFHNLTLEYDHNPPTNKKIQNLGEYQEVVDQIAPSIVKISGRSCVGVFFGSGFVAAPHMVITNAHVVTGSSSVYASDKFGSYPLTPLIIDNDHDVAVLYSEFIDSKPLDITDQPPPGTTSIVLGYPGGGDMKFNLGKVKGKTEIQIQNVKLTLDQLVFTDNDVAPGNSGGPILNDEGQVIALVSAQGPKLTVAIHPNIVKDALNKAKNKLFPTRSEFCGIPPKYF